MKEDSVRVVAQLQRSAHHVVMITGDNPLTACHVALQLKVATSDEVRRHVLAVWCAQCSQCFLVSCDVVVACRHGLKTN